MENRAFKNAIFRLERVTGVEPVSDPWQGSIIAAIRYPHDDFKYKRFLSYGQVWGYLRLISPPKRHFGNGRHGQAFG